jgi:hypothetical protein
MLKIKDNVDLKELEKYGFVYNEEYDFWSDEHPCCSHYDIDANGDRARIIRITDDIYYEEELDKLYDIINAGLVEKVVED